MPSGSYDQSALANVGRNYWAIEPVFVCTYLDKRGIEISSKFMYDINFENPDTDYESGDEFHFDYAIGKHLKNWTVGIGGFYYQQLEEDEQDGVTIDDSEGKQIAWGPMVAYQKGPCSVILKYQDETETENKPEGERLWLKVIFPL